MAMLLILAVHIGCHCPTCGPGGGGLPGIPGGGPDGVEGFGGPGGPGMPGGRHHHFGNPPPPYVLPPAQMLMHPGPGVGGPGPGVMNVPGVPHAPMAVSQVRFIGPPAGGGGAMRVHWQISGGGVFSLEPLVTPASMDFPQGAIYRLKLTHVPGLEDQTFYPTLEIGPSTPRTEAFLAHNMIPIQFTAQDFAQVATGNFVTKVIYLPDPEHQELALAGVEELSSLRLDPGVDPIVEADTKGTILAIIRMGNKDIREPAAPPGVKIKEMSYQEGTPGVPPGDPAALAPVPLPEYGRPISTPSFISGVTTVPYGMPITGTPIGLPGPPHIPLGIPAGLQMHSITNHTHNEIPRPVPHMQIHVKQSPGFHYPQPPNTMYLHERVIPGGGLPPPTVPPYEHLQSLPR
jgi:hypothetical protein